MAPASSAWFDEHNDYLLSSEWRERRRRVLERDNHQCQAGLPRCTGKATEVHHLHYRHWKTEPLFDLVAICRTCHDQITRMDRMGRSR